MTFEECPTKWDTQIDIVLKEAGSHLYILRACKYQGYSTKHLDLLFHSSVLSAFTYATELWGCCYYDKYLGRVDKLLARAYKSGYCLEKYNISSILNNRDKLWSTITSNQTDLVDLLPLERNESTLQQRP